MEILWRWAMLSAANTRAAEFYTVSSNISINSGHIEKNVLTGNALGQLPVSLYRMVGAT